MFPPEFVTGTLGLQVRSVEYVFLCVGVLIASVNVLDWILAAACVYPGLSKRGSRYSTIFAYETIVLWPLGCIAYYGAYASLGYGEVLASLEHDRFYAKSGTLVDIGYMYAVMNR
jgi:hypothetical protein